MYEKFSLSYLLDFSAIRPVLTLMPSFINQTVCNQVAITVAELTAMVEHALDDFVWIPAVADDELIIEVFFLILLELEPFITETNSLI